MSSRATGRPEPADDAAAHARDDVDRDDVDRDGQVPGAGHRVVCRLDALLADRGMTLTELAHRAGVTVVNLSVLKNDRARAIRFSTLTAVCDVLRCQPGDLLRVAPARHPERAGDAGPA